MTLIVCPSLSQVFPPFVNSARASSLSTVTSSSDLFLLPSSPLSSSPTPVNISLKYVTLETWLSEPEMCPLVQLSDSYNRDVFSFNVPHVCLYPALPICLLPFVLLACVVHILTAISLSLPLFHGVLYSSCPLKSD